MTVASGSPGVGGSIGSGAGANSSTGNIGGDGNCNGINCGVTNQNSRCSSSVTLTSEEQTRNLKVVFSVY